MDEAGKTDTGTPSDLVRVSLKVWDKANMAGSGSRMSRIWTTVHPAARVACSCSVLPTLVVPNAGLLLAGKKFRRRLEAQSV